LIICSASQEHIVGPGIGCATGSPQGNDPAWTFSDTNSFTWHMLSSYSISVGQTQMQSGYACVTSDQTTDAVNWSGYGSACQSSFHCTRFKGLCSAGSVTTDGANNATSSGAQGLTTGSLTHTTTATNDVIYAVGAWIRGCGGGKSIES